MLAPLRAKTRPGSGPGSGPGVRLRLLLAGLILVSTLAAGCGIKKLAIRSVAGTLSNSADVFASDEDPELVRDALPFALKTIETLMAEVPKHRGLLLNACQGFTQYAYAFVETDAEFLEQTDYRGAEQMRQRALRLYLRARDYGLRSLELGHGGITERFLVDPELALAQMPEREVPLLYWTGAAWGAAIALGKDRPELVADLPVVTALMRRALELDEDYGDGAIHEVMIVLESLPANMGGSIDRARQHFARAVELSGGGRASSFAALAENVALQAQNRTEFEELLDRALAIDPDEVPGARLQNLIVQRRARHLLGRADDLFLEP